MQVVRVKATTAALIGARNKRDAGRGVTPPKHTYENGDVGLELGEDVIARLQALARPGEDLEAVIVRVLWTTPALGAPSANDA